ncbi:MAG TPA: ATP-binding protein [Alphaproteobacteria bacterium]|jgi:two-component system phosphate regulon sensor histidine kinase PhoR
MTDPNSLVRHGFVTAALAAAPAGVVLAVLTAMQLVAWYWAAAGALAVFAGCLAVARFGLADLEAARRFIVALRPGEKPAPPPALPEAKWTPAARLASAAGETARAIAAAHLRLERRSAAAEAVLGDLPDGVLRIDRNRTVLDANPAAALLIGSAPVGVDLTGLLRDPGFTASVERALAVGGIHESAFTLHGESERSVRAIVRRVADGGPGEPAALVVLHDDTARRRLDQMRADFVANVSHELKTPLASLVGFIETLRGPAAGDEEARQRFLEIMQEQAARMRRLVDDIMSLSRIELEEHQAPTGRVALLPILQTLMEALQVQAMTRRITFRLERRTAEDDALEVAGDRDQLIQVFQNLLDNAIKYGREGTAVIIAVARAGGERLPAPRDAREKRAVEAVEAAVIDQGEGIPPEHLSRLTERFYRVDRGRSRQLGGTGLGLAIVKHILNRHGGRLAIESKIGQGSRFAVYLPAAEQRAAAAA